MFKVMSIADIHLNGGMETDEAQALMKAADIAIAEEVSVVLVNGDVYHSKSTPVQRMVFRSFIRELREGGSTVLILRGNHDEKDDLQLFDDRDAEIYVSEAPEEITVFYPGGVLYVHTIPHYNAAALALSSGSINDLGETGTGLYDQLVHKIFNSVRSYPGPSMVAFHGTVTDAHLDNGMIPKHDGIVLNGPLLSSIGCPVRGGHYHAAQEPHPNVRYSGSITLRNYGESGDKGVLIDTYENGAWLEPRFVSLEPSARITIDAEWVPGLGFLVNDDEAKDHTLFQNALLKCEFTGARVRFRYKVKQSEVASVDTDYIKQWFADAGVRELKIERDLIIETAVRSESIHQAHTVLDMHEAWLGMKNLEAHVPIQRALYDQIVNGIEPPTERPALTVIEGEHPLETAIA